MSEKENTEKLSEEEWKLLTDAIANLTSFIEDQTTINLWNEEGEEELKEDE